MGDFISIKHKRQDRIAQQRNIAVPKAITLGQLILRWQWVPELWVTIQDFLGGKFTQSGVVAQPPNSYDNRVVAPDLIANGGDNLPGLAGEGVFLIEDVAPIVHENNWSLGMK